MTKVCPVSGWVMAKWMQLGHVEIVLMLMVLLSPHHHVSHQNLGVVAETQEQPPPPFSRYRRHQAKMHTMSPQPFPFSLENTDGTSTGEIVYLKGNACDNWLEDGDGFSICSSSDDNNKHDVHRPRHQTEKASSKRSWYYCSDQEHNVHADLRYRVGGGTTKTNNKNSHTKVLRKSGARHAKSCEAMKEQHNKKSQQQQWQHHRSLPHDAQTSFGEYDDRSNKPTEQTQRQPHRQRKLIGITRNLVIPMVFADHVNRTLISIDDLSTLMNSPQKIPSVCPSGSIRSFFLENSNAQFLLDSFVHPWVTLSQTEAFYAEGISGTGNRVKGMITEALNLLNQANFDFTQFNLDQDDENYIDSILFIHSGYAAEHGGIDAYGTLPSDRIWSHQHELFSKWQSHDGVHIRKYMIAPSFWGISGTAIVRIGVIAHETAHNLGLPDMNDGATGNGLGSWSLMGNSWGFDSSQNYPPSLDPYSKLQVGWGQVKTLAQYQTNIVLEPVISNNEFYKIELGYRYREYLLIEYKKQWGLDKKVPTEGLVIYHVDEESPGWSGHSGYPGQEGWPQNGKHYRVSLLPADGKYDLERTTNRGDGGDVWVNNAKGLQPSNYGGLYRRYPNTDSYKDGEIMETGHAIQNIGSPGPNGIEFDFVQATCDIDEDCEDGIAETNEYCTIFRRCAVYGAPTAAPYQETNDCASDGESALFELYLTLDRYSQDTSWTLVGGGEIVLSEGDYKIEFEEIHVQRCIKKSVSYVFTILDSHGDGLCGKFSGKCGNFTVVYGGETVLTGSTFGSSMASSRFGGTTPPPTNPPTSYPTLYPTTYPTIHASFSPTEGPSLPPSHNPTSTPTGIQTMEPTPDPTERPTSMFTQGTSPSPSFVFRPTVPTIPSPSRFPTLQPSDISDSPVASSVAPTPTLSTRSSTLPSKVSTVSPSMALSGIPTSIPTTTGQPSLSDFPSGGPSSAPSNVPTIQANEILVTDTAKITSLIVVSNSEGLNATELEGSVYYTEFAEAYEKTARAVVIGPTVRPGRGDRQLMVHESIPRWRRRLVLAFLTSDAGTVTDNNCVQEAHLIITATNTSSSTCQMILASFRVLLINEVKKESLEKLERNMNEAIGNGILEQHLLSTNPLNPIRIKDVLRPERLSSIDAPTAAPLQTEPLPITTGSPASCLMSSWKCNALFPTSTVLGLTVILL